MSKMNAAVYYHILEIGVVYAKGNKRGKLWRLGERRYLTDECALWRKLVLSVEREADGVDCSEEVRREIQSVCDRYHLPNYKRVLELWNSLIAEDSAFNLEKEKRERLTGLMRKLIEEIEGSIKRFGGKADAYKGMVRLHNLPKALHGKDALGGGTPISYEDALRYAEQ